MPASRLLQLAREDDLDSFESVCLEALEDEKLQLADLVAAFEELQKRSHTDCAATLGQMVLDTLDAGSDPDAALKIAHIALTGDPANEELRSMTAGLYRRMHGEKSGFAALLELSGLESGRPVRNAFGLLDMCLGLEAGDALLSRTEDVVVEVLDVDLEHGLITLQGPRRPRTVTPLELSRDFERLAADDFRVMRALRPERLAELLETDPVAVVLGLIHAHGGTIDQDRLKHELVPKYISSKDWANWWSRARARLKRAPHVIIEGRAPVLLRYTAEALTLEDTTREAFEKQKDPYQWLATLEAYLREKRSHKEKPDTGLLARCHAHLDRHRRFIEDKRPAEALACALVGQVIDGLANDLGEDSTEVATESLRRCDDPAELIAKLESETLWTRALDVMKTARPDDAVARTIELAPVAPANLLDKIVATAGDEEAAALVQTHIDTALADPVDYPEIIFWLWKGPAPHTGLRLPPQEDLFTTLVETLSALGRTLDAGVEVTKRFRHRMRSALALRDYERARECLQRTSADRAITLRRQLERLEGLGDNARLRLLDLLRESHPGLWVAPRREVKPWENPDVLWNTASGIKRKTEERDHLVNVTMRDNAKRIGEAASHGDLSENSEYKFALEERDFLRARLAQMNHDLAIAETIEPHSVPTSQVGVGSRVTLRDLDSGAERRITFLGPFDTDVDRGIYNYRAPVSLQIMGLRVGDRATLPDGDDQREHEVIAIASGVAETDTRSE